MPFHMEDMCGKETLSCVAYWPCSLNLTPLGTNRYFRKVAVNNGISNTLVDVTDLKILEDAIKENTKVRMEIVLTNVVKVDFCHSVNNYGD